MHTLDISGSQLHMEHNSSSSLANSPFLLAQLLYDYPDLASIHFRQDNEAHWFAGGAAADARHRLLVAIIAKTMHLTSHNKNLDT